MGRPEETVDQPAPEGSVARRRPDTSLAEAATGFEPRVGLDEGLRATVAWYLTHPRP